MVVNENEADGEAPDGQGNDDEQDDETIAPVDRPVVQVVARRPLSVDVCHGGSYLGSSPSIARPSPVTLTPDTP